MWLLKVQDPLKGRSSRFCSEIVIKFLDKGSSWVQDSSEKLLKQSTQFLKVNIMYIDDLSKKRKTCCNVESDENSFWLKSKIKRQTLDKLSYAIHIQITLQVTSITF